MTPLKIFVILGSTRPNRYSEKPGAWMMQLLQTTPSVDAELIDLRDWDLPFYDQPTSPSQVKDGNYANPEAKKWAQKVAGADAFIIIAPEYNHGYPAVLKNALDSIYAEWNKKAVGFVGYGSALGARSIEQLRQVVIELQMVPIRNAVHMPSDIVAATRPQEGAGDPKFLSALDEKGKGMIEQLLWWARALKAARAQG